MTGDEWILANYMEYPSYKMMLIDYNELFGTGYSLGWIKQRGKKLGINKPKRHKPYTEEQIEWFKDFYPKHGVQETLEAFNEKFGENKTKYCIKNLAKSCGVTVECDVATRNKLKTTHGTGSKRELKPIGSTRMECGRCVMRTEDGWDAAGRVIWQKEVGDIPEGYCVTHLDGNTENYDITNLAMIPKKYLGLLQKNGLRGEAEITKTGIVWCKLYELLRKEGN